MLVGIAIFYTLTALAVGWAIIRKFFPGTPLLLSCVGSFLFGTGLVIPITYFLSWLSGSILWGTVLTLPLGLVVFRVKRVQGKISFSEVALAGCAIAFSTWMMFKTFHGSGGQLFVGSNNIFDFGFALGLIRSMSWGANIPIREPFFAGLPILYHYFFVFWVAVYEYFGIPIVWAMNIPGILSFTSLLIVIYYLPQMMAKQKPFVGWIAVLLTLTNSSLAFWKLLAAKGLSLEVLRWVWRLPTYPFAGPFDGSTVSIFVTLNSYVNQRHLAFAMAFGLLLILFVVRDIRQRSLSPARSALFGLLTGVLLLWNMVIYILVIIAIGILFIILKQWKTFFIFTIVSGITGFIFLLPIVGFLYKTIILIGVLVNSSNIHTLPTWNIFGYLWQNLGLLPVIAGLGFFALPKNSRRYFIPFLVLFTIECILASIGKRGFDQKLYSFLIIGINILAAAGIFWVWQKRSWLAKITAIFMFGALTVSGLIDLMPIKNEFAFPIVSNQVLPVISWIHANTAKDAVFVSYEDMIDPVVLAGRNNYYGFFKNIGYYDRSPDVRRIYAGDVVLAKARSISYILIPKWQKNDFPYTIDLTLLRKTYTAVYEDSRFIIFRTIK